MYRTTPGRRRRPIHQGGEGGLYTREERRPVYPGGRRGGQYTQEGVVLLYTLRGTPLFYTLLGTPLLSPRRPGYQCCTSCPAEKRGEALGSVLKNS